MKITDIETIPVDVPISPDRMIIGARGPHDRSPFLIVRVHTDEGLVGLGEVSCTPRWSGEDSDTARHVCERYLTPCLAGQDPTDVTRLTDLMGAAIVGHYFTKAAVEMALWDVLGKAHGVPLYRLLGGPARPGIRTKFSVAAAEPEVAAGIASWACSQGFTAMKVKVGTGLADDIARVAAVRAAIGGDVKLGWTPMAGGTGPMPQPPLRRSRPSRSPSSSSRSPRMTWVAWPTSGAGPPARSWPMSPSARPPMRSTW